MYDQAERLEPATVQITGEWVLITDLIMGSTMMQGWHQRIVGLPPHILTIQEVKNGKTKGNTARRLG